MYNFTNEDIRYLRNLKSEDLRSFSTQALIAELKRRDIDIPFLVKEGKVVENIDQPESFWQFSNEVS